MAGNKTEGAKGRSRRKRLGSFRASAFSQPSAVSETPLSFQLASERKALEKTVPGLGEAILSRIDEMTNLASSVMQSPPDLSLQLEHGDAEISAADSSIDTPSGFALRVLALSGSVRWRVMQQRGQKGRHVLELVRDVLDLAANLHALQTEFLDGPDIISGRAQVDAGRRGGRGRALAKKPALKARNLAWQAEAERIWSDKPHLTKLAVAESIKRNLKEKASITSIRKTIEKAGHEGST
ncbi:MAG: hypothetical protein V4707_03115 [Pseudomonadota bacterium]